MKGIELTLDSIIALLIMITIISFLVVFRTEHLSPFFTSQQLHDLSEDTLTILSESTIREVVNKTLLDYYRTPPHQILNESDMDKKAIDVIGALWSANRSEAANITKDILNDILPDNVGYQVLINGYNVYNSSDTLRLPYGNSTTEISSNRIASGYEFNKSVSGFVARAWASKVKRNVTKIIPINLGWGQYNVSSNYWGNGYAPAGERNGTATIRKSFTIPSDATIFSQYIQLSMDVGNAQVKINGNNVYIGGGGVLERNLYSNITPGPNLIEMSFNRTNPDLAHIHPGNYIKIKYNTSEVESGSNKTVFYSDWIRGSPAAAEIIPFFVNAHITNVTAYVNVEDMNAFLLVTLNYKYNRTNPMQNVLLYKSYPSASYCSQFTTQSNCNLHLDYCFWTPTTNYTLFHATFDSWSTAINCSTDTEVWSECRAADGSAYWRARIGSGSYNSTSTQYHEANNIATVNSTWITKCLDLSAYYQAYVTFWYNKTATSNPTNYTLFHATFDSWGATNCGGAATEGWSDCILGESPLYWNGTSGTASYNSSSTKYFEGNDIDTNNATWITKCLDLSSYQKAYVTFWYNKTATTSSSNEKQFILINKTGAGTMSSVWGSTTSPIDWTFATLDISNFVSSYTCIRYMVGAASSSSEKLRLDDFKIIGTNATDEKQFIMVNRTGAGSFTSIWNSSISDSPWIYKELNITNNISTYTCIRYMAGTVPSASKKLILDDFKLIGTIANKCNNIAADDIKNRTFEIILNQTGALIKEYNSTGSLLGTPTFNTNVSMNSVYDNMTNTFAMYADIRAPINATVVSGNGDVDWQRLGMYAHDDTAGHGSDHFCIITDKTNVTIYHDLEQYGLEYGKVDITQVQNFTGSEFVCETRPSTDTCKDANLSLSFPFDTNIITARIIGTQNLAGNDNGYNYVWMWYQGQQNETNMVLDSDTPPGTITYLPVKFFNISKLPNYKFNYVRVADKDPDGRYLLNDRTTFMGWNKSIVEYTFLIPSQVGYGDVFENQTNATDDAIERLSDVLGTYATSADVETENYTVSNVPHMWGPASIKIRLWS